MFDLFPQIPVDPEDFTKGQCYIAAAILGAGALGAAGTAYGASTAAGAQTRASQAALQTQREMFNTARGALQPTIDAGAATLPGLQDWINPTSSSSPLRSLINLTTPGASMTDTLRATPGYQFTEDRGLRATNNALAARGLGGSGGAVARGASEYVTGLADNTWKDVVDRLMATFTGGAGAMQSLVNTGANAGGNLAGGAIQSGNAQAGTQIGIGNAQGGAATAIGGAAGGLGSSLSTAAIIQRLMGQAPTSGSVYDTEGGSPGGLPVQAGEGY